MPARTKTHEYTLRCFEVEKASSSVPSLRNTNCTGHPCTVKHTKRDERTEEERRGEDDDEKEYSDLIRLVQTISS